MLGSRRTASLVAALISIVGLSFSNSGAVGDPVLAAGGDIACSSSVPKTTSCRQMATSDILVQGGIDAVAPLGDLQYDQGAESDFRAYYDPSWGRVKSITHPAPGNHDYDTAGAAGYYAYWGVAAGDPTKGYYSYELGTWHIIALNSNCSAVSCAAGSVQEQWLRADLAAHPTACTLAYWHHPRFSSGTNHGSDTAFIPFWNALHDFAADVVLNGHEHNYERFAPQDANGVADSKGIRQFVSGTGGKSHYSFGTPIANSEMRDSATFGVLKLTLHAASYDWNFVPEAGATFTDSGTGTCVGAGPRITIEEPGSGVVYVAGTATPTAGLVSDAPSASVGQAPRITVSWTCPTTSTAATVKTDVTDATAGIVFTNQASGPRAGSRTYSWVAGTGLYTIGSSVTCTHGNQINDGTDTDVRTFLAVTV